MAGLRTIFHGKTSPGSIELISPCIFCWAASKIWLENVSSADEPVLAISAIPSSLSPFAREIPLTFLASHKVLQVWRKMWRKRFHAAQVERKIPVKRMTERQATGVSQIRSETLRLIHEIPRKKKMRRRNFSTSRTRAVFCRIWKNPTSPSLSWFEEFGENLLEIKS